MRQRFEKFTGCANLLRVALMFEGAVLRVKAPPNQGRRAASSVPATRIWNMQCHAVLCSAMQCYAVLPSGVCCIMGSLTQVLAVIWTSQSWQSWTINNNHVYHVIAALPLRRFNMFVPLPSCVRSYPRQSPQKRQKKQEILLEVLAPLAPEISWDPGFGIVYSHGSTAPYGSHYNQSQSKSIKMFHWKIHVSIHVMSMCVIVWFVCHVQNVFSGSSGVREHSVRNLKVKVQSQEWGPTGSRPRLSALTSTDLNCLADHKWPRSKAPNRRIMND